jgi:hypothetical protein
MSSAPKAWIPVATAVVLFGVLVLSTTRDRNQIRVVSEARDSSSARAERTAEENASLLTAGDTLPEVTLRTPSGDSIELRRLPAREKYLYFGRADCMGCVILRPFIDAVPVARHDSIVTIAISPDSNVSGEAATFGDYTWVHRRGTRRRFVVHIPTLIVRSADNRVLSVAHGSLTKVASLFDLFGIVKKSDVSAALDSATKVANSRGIVVDTSHTIH